MFSIYGNVYKIGLLVFAAKITESPLGDSVEKKNVYGKEEEYCFGTFLLLFLMLAADY